MTCRLRRGFARMLAFADFIAAVRRRDFGGALVALGDLRR
jgi:hypothetical protein